MTRQILAGNIAALPMSNQAKFFAATAFLILSSLIYSLLFKGHLIKNVNALDNTTFIYSDSLASGWINWSWQAWVNFSNPAPTLSGVNSIAFGPNSWGALYLHSDQGLDIANFTSLRFAMKTSGPSTKFKLLIYDGNNNPVTQLNLSDFGGDVNVNSWTNYNIPISLVSTKFIKGLAWQEATGNNQSAIFIDEISFIKPESTPVPTPTPTPTPTPSPTLTPYPVPVFQPSSALNIYTDSLSPNWHNWSWGANITFGSVVSFTAYNSWAGLYLHTDNAVDTTPFRYLSFTAKATSVDQQYKVIIYDVNSQPIIGIPLNNYGPIPTDNFKQYNIPLNDLLAQNKLIKGIVIQEATGNSQPTIYIDNLSLTTGLNNIPVLNPTPAPTLTSVPTITSTPTTIPSNAGYSTAQGRIYKQGNQIKLKGVNWFGFETDTRVVHGLWVRNYKEMVSQIKNLGFNAVRVPVCPATIAGSSVSAIDYSKNTDLQGLNSAQILSKVLGELNNQGLYILLDHHRPDCQAISELWYTSSYSETQWIEDLKTLAARFANLPNLLGIDLKNEPHGQATWGTGNLATDWNQAAEKAGQAILSVNPNLLVFVEGVGENPNCSSNLGHFWGGNLEPQKCVPISTSSIPANKLVLSPHIYGPDVSYQSYFSDPNFPNNMPNIWDTQFGYLASGGFTLVPGEWGGKMGTGGGNPQDLTLQKALVNYMKNKGICNSFYWSWNPNSGDTGGILQEDWLTPWSAKMSILSDYFNTCN